VADAVETDEAFDPVGVGFLGAKGVVANSTLLANLVEELYGILRIGLIPDKRGLGRSRRDRCKKAAEFGLIAVVDTCINRKSSAKRKCVAGVPGPVTMRLESS
jgi:hypothetical protein